MDGQDANSRFCELFADNSFVRCQATVERLPGSLSYPYLWPIPPPY